MLKTIYAYKGPGMLIMGVQTAIVGVLPRLVVTLNVEFHRLCSAVQPLPSTKPSLRKNLYDPE